MLKKYDHIGPHPITGIPGPGVMKLTILVDASMLIITVHSVTRAKKGVLNFSLGNLSHLGDLLLWIVICRRANCVVHRLFLF